jgi:hypothetical protein
MQLDSYEDVSRDEEEHVIFEGKIYLMAFFCV